MSTSLPDRLRALADLIETQNLPEPRVLALQGPEYGSLHFDSHNDLCAWVEVLGLGIRVADFAPGGREPYTYYAADGAVGSQRLHLAYSEDIAGREKAQQERRHRYDRQAS